MPAARALSAKAVDTSRPSLSPRPSGWEMTLERFSQVAELAGMSSAPGANGLGHLVDDSDAESATAPPTAAMISSSHTLASPTAGGTSQPVAAPSVLTAWTMRWMACCRSSDLHPQVTLGRPVCSGFVGHFGTCERFGPAATLSIEFRGARGRGRLVVFGLRPGR